MAFFLFLTLSLASAYIKEGAIYELRGDEFYTFTSEFRDKIRIINFYIFSITGKQEFNSVYFQTAKKAQNMSLPIVFGKVEKNNAMNSKPVLEFQVSAVPHTIYYLANSDIPYLYTGPRTQEGLLNFMSNKHYKMHAFSSVEELKQDLMGKFYLKGLLLGVFNKNDVEIQEKFIRMSYDMPHVYEFGLMEYSEELGKEVNITGSALVACRGPGLISFQDDYYKSISNFTDLNITEWTRTHYHPHITYQTKDREKFLYTEAPLVTLLLDINNQELRERFIDKLTYWSKHLFIDDRDKQKYTWAIADKNEYMDELKADGLDKEYMLYVIKHQGKKYVVNEDVFYGNGGWTEVGIRRFYNQYSMGAAKPFKKVENIQKTTENGVSIATEDNFNVKVIKSRNEQLIYVHSGEEKYKKEIEALVGKGIEVVKINKATNKIDEKYENKDGEYVMFAQMFKKDEPKLYRGKMNTESILNFISKNSKREDL